MNTLQDSRVEMPNSETPIPGFLHQGQFHPITQQAEHPLVTKARRVKQLAGLAGNGPSHSEIMHSMSAMSKPTYVPGA